MEEKWKQGWWSRGVSHGLFEREQREETKRKIETKTKQWSCALHVMENEHDGKYYKGGENLRKPVHDHENIFAGPDSSVKVPQMF